MMDLVLQASLDMIAELGTVYIFAFLLFALRLLMMMENRNQFRYESAFIPGCIHDYEVTVFFFFFLLYIDPATFWKNIRQRRICSWI